MFSRPVILANIAGGVCDEDALATSAAELCVSANPRSDRSERSGASATQRVIVSPECLAISRTLLISNPSAAKVCTPMARGMTSECADPRFREDGLPARFAQRLEGEYHRSLGRHLPGGGRGKWCVNIVGEVPGG